MPLGTFIINTDDRKLVVRLLMTHERQLTTRRSVGVRANEVEQIRALIKRAKAIHQ